MRAGVARREPVALGRCQDPEVHQAGDLVERHPGPVGGLLAREISHAASVPG